MKTMTMASANGKAPIQIEKILDEELGADCESMKRFDEPILMTRPYLPPLGEFKRGCEEDAL